MSEKEVKNTETAVTQAAENKGTAPNNADNRARRKANGSPSAKKELPQRKPAKGKKPKEAAQTHPPTGKGPAPTQAEKPQLRSWKKSMPQDGENHQSEQGTEIEKLDRKAFIAASEERKKRNRQAVENAVADAARLLEVKQIIESEKIVYARIVGVERMGVFNTPCAVLNYNDNTIIVPYNDLFRDYQGLVRGEDESDEKYAYRQEQVLSSCMGANIGVIVSKILDSSQHGTFRLLGSRVAAMDRDAQRFYFARKGGDGPYVRVDGIYDADIIGVGAHGLRVYLRGYDIQVWVGSLTFKWIESAKDHYHPGDKLRVRVRKIQRNPKTGGFDIEVSGKDIEFMERKKNSERVTVGGSYIATVTRIVADTASRDVIVYLYIDAFSLPATARMMTSVGSVRRLSPGGTVSLRVNAVDANGAVRGTIVNIISSHA